MIVAILSFLMAGLLAIIVGLLLTEEEPPDGKVPHVTEKLHVNSTGRSISVFALPEEGAIVREPWPRALAAADLVGDYWWVSRVIVRLPGNRGRGLGSLVLTRLLQEIQGQPCKRVHVSPGGYHDDTEKQRAFYLKNGFKPTDAPDLLVWEPPEQQPEQQP